MNKKELDKVKKQEYKEIIDNDKLNTDAPCLHTIMSSSNKSRNEVNKQKHVEDIENLKVDEEMEQYGKLPDHSQSLNTQKKLLHNL